MTSEQFKLSLDGAAPPTGLSGALQALWWAAKGNWDTAHNCAQDDGSAEGAWVHAYLHRVEGDEANAGYWYRQAGQSPSALSLKSEWSALTASLLQSADKEATS